MLRIVVTICAVSQLATALPQQRPVGVPVARPIAQQVNAPAASAQVNAFSPAYQQQINYGAPQAAAAQAQRARGQSPFQAQPIILQQPSASPATPTFGSFGGGSPFGGAGRQILTLRSPASADEDEYEYEDDDEPTIGRPAAKPAIPTRTPVRVASPTPGGHYGAVPGRFNPSPVVPQQQPVRHRQPIQTGLGGGVAAAPARGPPSPNYGIDGKRSRLTTPPPIQTVNRYHRQNDDGSVTWGYENEDGTFKEETLGADCVVRGKYGYVDPEGNKREYEYQTGNPCDPNKKDQEEEEEEERPEGPSRPQQLAGVLNARPRPVQRRPVQHPQQGGPPLQYPHQQQYQPQPQYALS